MGRQEKEEECRRWSDLMLLKWLIKAMITEMSAMPRRCGWLVGMNVVDVVVIVSFLFHFTSFNLFSIESIT